MSAPLEPEQVAASFGRLLRAERQRRLLSQTKLAELAGLHRTHIGYLELGRRLPALTTIADVAGALGIAPSTFIDELGVVWIPAGRRGSGYGPAGFFAVRGAE